MIWVFHKDPKLCAEYYPDNLIWPTMQEIIKALDKGKGKWGKWAFKRSQNWRWLFRLLDYLGREYLNRDISGDPIHIMMGIMDWLFYHTPYIPCHPRGLKTKFPQYGTKIKGISNKAIIHEYRKQFNEQFPISYWATEEPFWYYGNID
jgi:hypothetical protein